MPDLAEVRGSAVAHNIGVAGILGTVLLFAATILGSPGEPPLDATSAGSACSFAGSTGTSRSGRRWRCCPGC
jgi:hypothetical protein